MAMKHDARLATSTACSAPLSSITARRSSIHSSMDGSSAARTGSDRPVPRLSKVSTRPNRPSRPMNSASGGTSHWLSTLLNHWVSITMSTGPVPACW
jgi:transglutaminase/protease-like cytokinesis protein 3